MSNTDMTQEQFFDELDELFGTYDGYINHLERIKEAVSGDTMIRNHPYPTKLRNENEELKKQNAELKELTDGIMNEEGTQHILGCNAYEKFCQAMSELNFDENWISEMKVEHTRLKEESDHIQSDLEDEQEEHHWTQNDLEQLKEDLEPLQEMMDKIKDVNEYKDVVDYVNGLHGKNLELQEKLEEPDVDWKVIAKNKTKILMKYLPDYNPAFYPGSDIENLEECFKKLKESAQSTENYWKSKYENEQSTNKMLNEAIINHSEILDELRTYLSNFDGDEVEVFDKIVKSTD